MTLNNIELYELVEQGKAAELVAKLQGVTDNSLRVKLLNFEKISVNFF